MSYETTMARGLAEVCERDWKQHKAHCAACYPGPPRRKREDLCDTGLDLYDAHRAAQAELAENLRLDKEPPPGQGTLL